MIKIDFSKVKVQVSFDGTHREFNIAKNVGNDMMFNGSVIADIGFEELAKKIYFSEGEVEIPDVYVPYIAKVISESNYIAAIKRHLMKVLNGKQ